MCFLPARVHEASCTGYRVRSFGFGTHVFTCWYESSGQTLVGAEFIDDVSTFCNRTSNALVAGDLPTVSCIPLTEIADPCPAAAP